MEAAVDLVAVVDMPERPVKATAVETMGMAVAAVAAPERQVGLLLALPLAQAVSVSLHR
jgi:hypothetical protein